MSSVLHPWRANAHGRMGKSNITLPQRPQSRAIQGCDKRTLLGNSSLRGTEQTHYIIVHAKMVLEMINTKSESDKFSSCWKGERP